MLGLLGILLGMAAFWGFLWGVEILQQRADDRVYRKALASSIQESTDRYVRELEIIDKYRKQKELASKIFNEASDVRFEALDAIAKLDKMLGSAEGEEYTLLTQKIEGLEKFAKTLESGMEVLKEIFLCDEVTAEGRDKIDYILSTCGTTLEEVAQSMGIDIDL